MSLICYNWSYGDIAMTFHDFRAFFGNGDYHRVLNICLEPLRQERQFPILHCDDTRSYWQYAFLCIL